MGIKKEQFENKSIRLRIVYKGELDKEKDEAIKVAILTSCSYKDNKIIGSGYNFITGERDIEFELEEQDFSDMWHRYSEWE